MKKFICLFTVLCLLVPFFSLGANAVIVSDTTPDFDYNNDGKININDARTILRVSAGIDEEIEGKTYDLDRSGFVDYYDVAKILRMISGIDSEANVSNEYLLALFKEELDSVKSVRPGFTKVSTSHCKSAKVTTTNAPDSSLNVTNTEFNVYVDKVVAYTNKYSWILTNDIKKELENMKTQAQELYQPQTETVTVTKANPTHYTEFPVNKLGYACFLELSDIESINCYEQNGYIIREVIMKTDTYIGDQYPTGSAGFKDRWQIISYGKVFNIPAFDETDGSTLNSVKFSGLYGDNINVAPTQGGRIISKVDKLTGMPVEIRYEYSCVSDISAAPQVNQDGTTGLTMKTVTITNFSEVYTINSVEAN